MGQEQKVQHNIQSMRVQEGEEKECSGMQLKLCLEGNL